MLIEQDMGLKTLYYFNTAVTDLLKEAKPIRLSFLVQQKKRKAFLNFKNNMIKKILFILAYPFILFYMVVSLPFKIVYIIIKDKKNNQAKKKRQKINNDADLLYISELLFANCKTEFKAYYNLYLTDKEKFNTIYKPASTDDDANLKPIDVLQQFGDQKQKLGFVDWKGEENINEIEEFIESQIDKKVAWVNTIALRGSVKENKQRDGKFIVKLFKAINKDLQNINYQLLFFDMGWDAYVYMPVTTITFDKVLENAPTDFQSADEL